MKIIDLINKIANGEEVPKKIKYEDEEFVFTGYDSASKNYDNDLEDLFEVLDGSVLNDEVEILEEEILEEEKKIPEKLLKDEFDELTKEAKLWEIFYKYNDLIDYLNSKGDE